MTLSERLRGDPGVCDILNAADALDAQEKRIKALEGALREAARIDYEMEKGGGVSGAEMRAFRKRARALLTPDET